MRRIRDRLTYANVVSTLCLFLLLGGGAAFGASQLGKNTVGPKQLKKNAVTTAKIKKNAVTAAKIKKNAVTAAKIKSGAVDGTKVKDGSLTGADVNAATMPFARVVAKARGSSSVDVPTSGPGFALYPLESATYTQTANEDDGFLGAVDVTFQSSCTGHRRVRAYILLDTNPAAPSENDIVAVGAVGDEGSGTVSKRVEISGGAFGPFIGGGRFEPGTAKSHTISVLLTAQCEAGSGVTATFGGVDVIGITS